MTFRRSVHMFLLQALQGHMAFPPWLVCRGRGRGTWLFIAGFSGARGF